MFNDIIDDLSETNLEGKITKDDWFGLLGIERKEPKVSPESLRNLSPRDFEKLTGRLFERMGFTVRLTPESRDGGIDAEAIKVTDTGQDRIIIQCKHYPGRKVGVEEAREFYGATANKPFGTRGHLVTSGSFSDDCLKYSNSLGVKLELYDVNRLLGLLEKYEVHL